MDDYYSLLGVNPSASEAELKRAYYTLIKKHSPEKDPAMFKKIREAYTSLGDPAVRTELDRIYQASPEARKGIFEAFKLAEDREFEQAIKVLKSSKAQDDPVLMKCLGEFYIKNKNTQTAIKHFEGLWAENPQDKETALLLADAYEARGYKKKAKDQYKLVVAMDSENPKAWVSYMKVCETSERAAIFKATKKIPAEAFREYPHYYYTYLMQNLQPYEEGKVDDYVKACFKAFIAHANAFPEKSVDEIEDILMITSRYGGLYELNMEAVEKLERRSHEMTRSISAAKPRIKFNEANRMKGYSRAIINLTRLLLVGVETNNDKLAKQVYEAYILEHETELKESILEMKEKFPSYYALNSRFYDYLYMNPKTHRQLVIRLTREGYNNKLKYPEFYKDISDQKLLSENPLLSRGTYEKLYLAYTMILDGNKDEKIEPYMKNSIEERLLESMQMGDMFGYSGFFFDDMDEDEDEDVMDYTDL
ncbi:MAG: DnaJ domain-containing protein [Clostridiales bacterium]|nr:DnaJ domain-containing protein [Clostridiales bacterium]